MAEGNITASNYAVATVLASWRSLLTTSSTLRLYQNNVTIDPTLSWSAFVEATFTGYSPASLAGLFAVPTNPSDGEFETSLPALIFSCTGGSAQTVYGAAILDGSGNLWFSYPFPSPIVFTSGVAYAVQVDLFEWAASLIP
jgi:hypothetical protein